MRLALRFIFVVPIFWLTGAGCTQNAEGLRVLFASIAKRTSGMTCNFITWELQKGQPARPRAHRFRVHKEYCDWATWPADELLTSIVGCRSSGRIDYASRNALAVSAQRLFDQHPALVLRSDGVRVVSHTRGLVRGRDGWIVTGEIANRLSPYPVIITTTLGMIEPGVWIWDDATQGRLSHRVDDRRLCCDAAFGNHAPRSRLSIAPRDLVPNVSALIVEGGGQVYEIRYIALRHPPNNVGSVAENAFQIVYWTVWCDGFPSYIYRDADGVSFETIPEECLVLEHCDLTVSDAVSITSSIYESCSEYQLPCEVHEELFSFVPSSFRLDSPESYQPRTRWALTVAGLVVLAIAFCGRRRFQRAAAPIHT